MILFIDMNSFFATCEQQYNYYLRGRPVGVCVYTGKYGAIIAPSIEAKRFGVKTGMRLNDAMQLCPDLVPLETNSGRYREVHVKIMNVLRKYSGDVIPKSIDEAIVDLQHHKHLYKNLDDMKRLANQIKGDIRGIGDYLKCSIGIAPNAFLAKLASDLQKPDGLSIITPDNIDEVLSRLKLTDLPGIADGMSNRLINAGIDTPLKLRYADPAVLKVACQSIVGVYWHYRLNFSEVDLSSNPYKNMQAMRQLSREQRASPESIENIFIALCMKLEKRMVAQGVYCKEFGMNIAYQNGQRWKYSSKNAPIQEGTVIYHTLKAQLDKYAKEHGGKTLLHEGIAGIGINVSDFVTADVLQVELFEDNVKKDHLRKAVYDLKDRFGYDKLMRAMELKEGHSAAYQDLIGFGSIKDMYNEEEWVKNGNKIQNPED
jgi:DNA polymerase-4